MNWKMPRQLINLGSETVIERTIRLLKENGIEDIAISTNNPIFRFYGVEIIGHINPFVSDGRQPLAGHWVDAFPPRSEPTCYLFGDVVFSEEAIKTIVNTETNDIEFFASAPPFAENYPKPYAEPFGFKVVNTEHFRAAVEETKQNFFKFNREPIAWELWQVIKKTPYNRIILNYTAINDFTCDIDSEADLKYFKFLEDTVSRSFKRRNLERIRPILKALEEVLGK